MIHSWQLYNFKSIKGGMNPIELRNLTVISGANSSGKSTVIQSILLLMQTLANRDNVALQLNGELVSLGEVGDIWHNGILPRDTSQLLELSITLQDIDGKDTNIYINVKFAPVEESGSDVYVVSGEYAMGTGGNPQKYEYRLHIGLNENDDYIITLMSQTLLNEINQELFSAGLTDVVPFNQTLVEVEDFYPRSLLIEAQTISRVVDWGPALADKRSPVTEDELAQVIPSEYWQEILRIGTELNLRGLETSPFWLVKKKPAIRTLGEYRKWFDKLPRDVSDQLEDKLKATLPGVIVNIQQYRSTRFFERLEQNLVEQFTRNIRYLSANRLEPTMLFGAALNTMWSEVGITGNNIAQSIRDHGERTIRFWHPIDQTVQEQKFIEVLILWLRYFDLLNSVEIEDQGKLGTLFRVHTLGVDRDLDLTSVGFGTSQVIPIIAQGLLTPPKGLFIVEQPEVHLHPKVQSQLADFFLSLARVNVQCIVETHSEHIINRLRLRIVESAGKEILNLIRIYFAERKDGESKFFAVEPNEYGAIGKWPDGFFDQSENEHLRIARLATLKKKGGK